MRATQSKPACVLPKFKRVLNCVQRSCTTSSYQVVGLSQRFPTEIGMYGVYNPYHCEFRNRSSRMAGLSCYLLKVRERLHLLTLVLIKRGGRHFRNSHRLQGALVPQ
jgi:hypothetical protein